MRYEHYTVVIEPDEEEPQRYNVHVPALPGCLTYGESIDDALANAVEAIQGYVATVVSLGADVPIERHPSIAATIAVPLVDVPRQLESEDRHGRGRIIATRIRPHLRRHPGPPGRTHPIRLRRQQTQTCRLRKCRPSSGLRVARSSAPRVAGEICNKGGVVSVPVLGARSLPIGTIEGTVDTTGMTVSRVRAKDV